MIEIEAGQLTEDCLDLAQFSAGRALKALSELEVGRMAIVDALELPDEIGHHLMHMGFIPEARVVVIRRAPAGDPTVYAVDGFEIALRRETARSIKVRPVEENLSRPISR